LSCIAIAHYTAQLLLGSYQKIMIDSAFFSYQIFCFFFLFLWIIPYFERQLTYQTFAFFLPKLSRTFFYYQTIFGFIYILCVACIIFYSANLVGLWYLTGQWFFHLIWGFLSIACENVILLSAALFFSLILSQALSCFATVSFYVLCYTNHDWYALQQKKDGIERLIGTFFYYCLPDLALFDIKSQVLYELPIELNKVALSIAYAFCFSALFLVSGQLCFSKKSL
jgi:hypothetical protein